MEAVILAGGRGTRLQPLTVEVPKPLVKIGGRPILEILLRRMQQSGVRKVHLAVNHLADQIEAVVGDGSVFGVTAVYSHESEPLSTVGPIKLLGDLPEDFLVANGDILTDLDFRALFSHHLRQQALLTVATHARRNQVDYGVLEVNRTGQVTAFREKPVEDLTVSMGVYAFSRRVLDYVPSGQPFGFDDLMHALLTAGVSIETFAYQGYWLDIGRLEDHTQAQFDIERLPHLLD